MELHHAHLVAIWLEGLLYGLYIPIFATAVYYLTNRPYPQINKTMLAVTVVLFMLGTMHIAGSIKAMIDAFITFPDRLGGPAAFFANETEPINLFRAVVFAISILVGDGLVIYRCFIVWSRNWWIVAGPIASIIATFLAGLVVTKELCSLIESDDVFSPTMLIWVPLYFSLSFFTNLLVTFLIGLRLWRVSRGLASSRTRSQLCRTVAILTESAALYPILNLITLILFAAKDNSQAIPANSLCQIIGIAPTLIVVQVQAGLSEADREHSNDSRKRRSTTGRISRAITDHRFSTFGHGSNSAPIVMSFDWSIVDSPTREIPEKESPMG